MSLGLDGGFLAGVLAHSGELLVWGSLLGALAGSLAGLLGIGGGIVLVPGITLLLERLDGVQHDLAIKTAIGTSLAIICLTSLSSLRAHARRGAVRWDVVLGLAPGIVLGSLVAASIARRVPGDVLVVAFCAFVLMSALRMLRRRPSTPEPVRAENLPRRTGMAAAGLAIGGAASLVGAGGAFISVPFLRWRGIGIHQAIGTSSAIGLPVAISGALAYAWAGWSAATSVATSATAMAASTAAAGSMVGRVGFVHLPSLVVIALASVLFAPLGARVAHRLSRQRLEQVFGLLLVALALAMLARAALH